MQVQLKWAMNQFLYHQGANNLSNMHYNLKHQTCSAKPFVHIHIKSVIVIVWSKLLQFSSCSIKALRHEREFLARRLQSRLTEDERERLYIKWQVPLEGKQRKLQLVYKLWADPNDPAHIEESADIVARLVGFCEGGNMAKEMFELNFTLPASKKPWLLGWQPISNLLRL